MLEGCNDLAACEFIILELIKNIRLLGEISFSDKDIDILTDLIRQNLIPNISKGFKYLITKTPACFACFLVVMGKFYDKDAGYWPIVEQKIGPIDLNWQVKWGKFFLKFLLDHNLPKFDEEEGLAYVTPILSHVCIPDSCLDEYFEKIVTPLVCGDLYNPFDEQEISADLFWKRNNNFRRLDLEKKIKEKQEINIPLQNSVEKLNNQKQVYQIIASLIADEENCRMMKIKLNGLDNADVTRSCIETQINELKDNIIRLETEEKRLLIETSQFEKIYKPIIDNQFTVTNLHSKQQIIYKDLLNNQYRENQLKELINAHWSFLSENSWNDEFENEILHLSLDDLYIKIINYQNFLKQQQTIQENIENLKVKEIEIKTTWFTTLFKYIINAIHNWYKKSANNQLNEVQILQETLFNIKSNIQRELDSIKQIINYLPINNRLLENPNILLYEELITFQKTCFEHVYIHEQRLKLEIERDKIDKQILKFTTQLNFIINEQHDSWLEIYEQIYKEALHKKESALFAKHYLETEILPTLVSYRSNLQNLQINLEILDKLLADIGNGSTQEGLFLVEESRKKCEDVTKLRESLQSQYPNIYTLEKELVKKGVDKILIDYQNNITDIEKQIKNIEGDVNQLQKEIDIYPAPYIGIDEPIRRFLLYGGFTAEKIFINSVLLFANIKSGKEIYENMNLELPDRYIIHFKKWWGENYSNFIYSTVPMPEEIKTESDERFRKPQLVIDTIANEILIQLPSQRLNRPRHEDNIYIEVFNQNESQPIYASPLRLYRYQKELIESQACENIILKAPSEKYIIQIKHNNNLIKEWQISGFSKDNPFLAFDIKSKNQIIESPLPRSKIIIVIENTLKIFPEECILTEGGELYGEWKNYIWYELDLSFTERLQLVNGSDEYYPIPIISSPRSSIDLKGGNVLEGVVSTTRPVYNIAPEFIRIPAMDKSEYQQLRFSIISENEGAPFHSKHYSVLELINWIDKSDQDFVDIPLNDEKILGINPIGCFTLRIHKQAQQDWRKSFCIIPQFSVSFDKELYSPYYEIPPNVSATIIHAHKCDFIPDSPTKRISHYETSLSTITPLSENIISGMIKYSINNQESIKIPLTISIPKILWRLQGLTDPKFETWFDKVQEELWIGDWENTQKVYLLVKLPGIQPQDTITLSIKENAISGYRGKIQDEEIRFDMKALEDTLRQGVPLATISIFIKNSQKNQINIPLFTIRTHWLAEKIKCFQYPIGDTLRLDITWKEKGKANQKVVSLWYLADDQPKFIQKIFVSKNEQEAYFESKPSIIKSGKYLIHLEPSDQWSSNNLFPNLDDPNTAIIEIVTKTKEKYIIIRKIAVDEQHIYPLPQDSYRINIIGKIINQKLPDNYNGNMGISHELITPSNENWYKGNLEVEGIPDVISHLSDTNPVKFEYDAKNHIVTCIEDSHGDGAIYCYECNKLFWYQETLYIEKKKKHRNYGPITKFIIDWDSE